MNGAECLLRTLLDCGVDTCFMNPGTSEMQFVAALDRVPGMRGVLCLFEGVCSGAADGYARMTGKPAATLLHLGPGLANGLSNFHNARKAGSPIVSIVGEHTTQHLRCDAPLTADTVLFARTVSDHVRVLGSAECMGSAAAETVRDAWLPPGKISHLIVPADYSWDPSGAPGVLLPQPVRAAPDARRVRETAKILRSGEPSALLLNGSTLTDRGLEAAARIAGATGVAVFTARFFARMQRGGRRFRPERLAYFPEPAQAMLAGLKHLILAESRPPVSFFGYPGCRSEMAPEDCQSFELALPSEDGTGALEALAAELGGTAAPAAETRPEEWPRGEALNPDTAGRVLAALLPENAIISDEAISSGEPIWRHLTHAAPHDHLPVTGGSIGQALPVAVGAAIACPDRKVVAVEGDGSGMYTLQALWTMARERLDVITIVLANKRYRILDIEMRRTGAVGFGSHANDMIDLTRPELDWVLMAAGMGVPAARASNTDEFAAELARAFRAGGPHLIEAVFTAS
jgi:acetolactate synthase I/II/III large subunit